MKEIYLIFEEFYWIFYRKLLFKFEVFQKNRENQRSYAKKIKKIGDKFNLL